MQWGKGNIHMEGVGVRVTITSPQYDSLTIIPLSQSGQPLAGLQPISVARRAGNKFTTLIDTKTYNTPWYKLVFGVTTNVAEDTSRHGIAVLSQPVYDGVLRMRLTDGAMISHIVDVQGQVVLSEGDYGALVDVSKLTSGVYFVVVRLRDGAMLSTPFVVHEK
jgi:hypothetical protein